VVKFTTKFQETTFDFLFFITEVLQQGTKHWAGNNKSAYSAPRMALWIGGVIISQKELPPAVVLGSARAQPGPLPFPAVVSVDSVTRKDPA
jgi:hypothetical protein